MIFINKKEKSLPKLALQIMPNYHRTIHLELRQSSLNHKCLSRTRLETFFFVPNPSILLPSLFFSKSSLIINSAYTEEWSRENGTASMQTRPLLEICTRTFSKFAYNVFSLGPRWYNRRETSEDRLADRV